MADPSEPVAGPAESLAGSVAPSGAAAPSTDGDGHSPNGHAGGHGNGHIPHGLVVDPLPRRPPGPPAKPAAIVFAIIAVIFLAGFAADEVTSSHHGSPAPSPTPVKAVAGTGGLVPEPASDVLGAIVQSGEPPSNVLAALVVPKGTSAVPGTASQKGLGLYDASIDLQAPAVAAHVITFVRSELRAGKWQTVSAGASGNAYQFIAEHPGSDGYEWELGVTISPTTFSSATPSATPSNGVTAFQIRLFAVSDE
ncbi:MAG TPA: hypothetical protein VEJ21_00800 [Acidimicrobiales bacterium]|nr:hypothetical protein [Acidimicrobiales bacterium]